jgi:hypothetical protein
MKRIALCAAAVISSSLLVAAPSLAEPQIYFGVGADGRPQVGVRDPECQCRVNFPQKCRSKIPRFGRSERRGGTIFGWAAAAPRGRLSRRRDGRFRPQMLRHELGVLAQAIT